MTGIIFVFYPVGDETDCEPDFRGTEEEVRSWFNERDSKFWNEFVVRVSTSEVMDGKTFMNKNR